MPIFSRNLRVYHQVYYQEYFFFKKKTTKNSAFLKTCTETLAFVHLYQVVCTNFLAFVHVPGNYSTEYKTQQRQQ